MIGKLLAGIFIVGIAIIKLFEVIPVSASHIENTYVIQKSDPQVMKCRKEIVNGQGVQIINRAGSFAGNCLYDTNEDESNWELK